VILREVEETRELLTRMEFPSSASKGEPKPNPQPKPQPKPPPTTSGALSASRSWPFASLLAAAEETEKVEKPTAGPKVPSEAPPPTEAAPPAKSPPSEPGRTAPGALEPGEEPETPEARTPEQIRNRALLAVQRAQNTLLKDRNDILEIADAFDEIREELINNRIDSEKLRRRLKEGIADPLRRIAQDPFPRLEQRLHELEATLDHPEEGPRNRLLAVQQLDAILLQLQEVLHQMIELETFNEAVAALRAIIEAQQKLHEETQKYHKERLRKLGGE